MSAWSRTGRSPRLIVGGATLLAGAVASYRWVVVPFARGDRDEGPPDPEVVLMLRATTIAAGALGLATLLTGLARAWLRH